MIRFRAFGIQFSLPPLTLAMPFLARRLGMEGPLTPLLLALGAHELAHLAAAKLTRVGISEIRLMPFGGCARMENPYRIAPWQLVCTALAGPAANLLLMLVCSALAHWGWIAPMAAAGMLAPNLILMLFNLLPALPLDGGRVLYALLCRPLGDGKALKLGLWLGRILSGLLLALMLFGGIRHGKWNLSFAFAAVFILASERDERSALSDSIARRCTEAMEDSPEPRPARIYQLDDQTPVEAALKLLRPKERAWFVLTHGGAPSALIDGGSIVRHLVQNGGDNIMIGALPGVALGGTLGAAQPLQRK